MQNTADVKKTKTKVKEQDENTTEVAVSKNDNPILIQKTKNGMFFTIKFAKGGEIPKEFKGLFTSYKDAEHQVEVYKSRKNLDNGESSSGQTTG